MFSAHKIAWSPITLKSLRDCPFPRYNAVTYPNECLSQGFQEKLVTGGLTSLVKSFNRLFSLVFGFRLMA